MSTKGLMSHKKVAEVTLNEAGKAATLTLKHPWLYKGSPGPFPLTAVDHGHDIVKKARPVGQEQYSGPDWAPVAKGARSPRAPTGAPKTATTPDPSTASHDELANTKAEYKGGMVKVAIYRVVLGAPNIRVPISDGHSSNGHEIGVWLRYKRSMPRNTVIKDAKAGNARSVMRGDPKEYTEATVTRWTVKDEREAASKGHAGSPWGSSHTADAL